jgi:hypothetical protein
MAKDAPDDIPAEAERWGEAFEMNIPCVDPSADRTPTCEVIDSLERPVDIRRMRPNDLVTGVCECPYLWKNALGRGVKKIAALIQTLPKEYRGIGKYQKQETSTLKEKREKEVAEIARREKEATDKRNAERAAQDKDVTDKREAAIRAAKEKEDALVAVAAAMASASTPMLSDTSKRLQSGLADSDALAAVTAAMASAPAPPQDIPPVVVPTAALV